MVPRLAALAPGDAYLPHPALNRSAIAFNPFPDQVSFRPPETRIGVRGLDEHLCRVTRDDGRSVLGIYQAIDPTAYEACVSERR